MALPFVDGQIPTAADFNNLSTFAAEAANAQISPNVAAAAASASAAAVARDAAIAAWSASMAPAEILPAISQSIHSGAIVKTFLYDTSRDSDGGAWRKRCADKSWYNETICTGTWRQQRTNLAAAWAITGAVAGDYYQNTTDGKFYMIGGTVGAQTQAEVFRGGRRECPANPLIIVEAGRGVIYDADTPGCPMWMVLVPSTAFLLYGSGGITSLCAANGQLFIGSSGAAPGLCHISFLADSGGVYQTDKFYKYKGNIAQRHSSLGVAPSIAVAIVNNTVNDVAMTVLDGAVFDDATGLPKPTVYVGTAGGLSTITNSGTVVNSTSTVSVVKCVADGKRLTTVRSDGVVSVWNDTTTMSVAPNTTYTTSSVPALMGTVTAVA